MRVTESSGVKGRERERFFIAVEICLMYLHSVNGFIFLPNFIETTFWM